jgi:hypothetical protein
MMMYHNLIGHLGHDVRLIKEYATIDRVSMYCTRCVVDIATVWRIDDEIIECPNHGGAFDCTPFCKICAGNQEFREMETNDI